MRKYNSETDYPTLRDAVLATGRGGGFLTAAKEALESVGVEWPSHFNFSREPEARAIDSDCSRAFRDDDGLRSIYDACLAAGVPMDSHESDLYIPVNETTTAILRRFGSTASTFTNQVAGGLWYDVPFAFLPWWEKRQALASK